MTTFYIPKPFQYPTQYWIEFIQAKFIVVCYYWELDLQIKWLKNLTTPKIWIVVYIWIWIGTKYKWKWMEVVAIATVVLLLDK